MSFDHRTRPGLRFGVVGVGERGRLYAQALAGGQVPGGTLAAVCDPDPTGLAAFDPELRVSDLRALEALAVDAWVVATPPLEHPAVLERAFAANVHVLCEKPLATTAAEGRRLLSLHQRSCPDRVLGVALPLRVDPRYVTLRRLLGSGTLGDVTRVAWTVTDCLRTDAYYRSRPWRARAGGGGGVLMNQCLHQLDLLIWLFGMPLRVRADVGIGRQHPIEVEDDVTALFELDGGARGVLVASTGEAPGVNRLEVVGTRARVVLEGGALELTRNARATPDELRQGPVRAEARAAPVERTIVGTGGAAPGALLAELVLAAVERTPMSADAAAGLRSVELAEAILLSGAEARTIELAREPPLAARRTSSSRPDAALPDM